MANGLLLAKEGYRSRDVRPSPSKSAIVALSGMVGFAVTYTAVSSQATPMPTAHWAPVVTAKPVITTPTGISAFGRPEALTSKMHYQPTLLASQAAPVQAAPEDVGARVLTQSPSDTRPLWGIGATVLAVATIACKLGLARKEPSPLAMVAVTGQPFDPLGLASASPQPRKASVSLDVNHGRLCLAGLVGSGILVTAGPAMAEGIDFGFNYDFEVDFEGIKIDHRILVDTIVTGQAIGFIGALIGGVSARARKQEVEQLANKLKLVNRQLRQQARQQKEGVYTPNELTGCDGDEVCEIDRTQLLEVLRKGKALLRDGKGDEAIVMFRQALNMETEAKEYEGRLLVDRKAYRGIGGAHVQCGRPAEALEAMLQVLALTDQIGDNTGLCDAYGVIADIYTDLDQLGKAAEYYDKYIEIMNSDLASEAV